ncbi:MAG: ABC transporter ATP-binding protein [Clostridiales bacterium]|nr:ABC transporter ATP-binding protein [Clostridiales bacterium]
MYAIKTEAISKKYKDAVAVDGLSLTVNEGELFALLGVNGAGKSTLIKMLSCVILPTGGSAEIMGHDILSEREKVKTLISVSPQETAVAQNLSVRENLQLMLGIHGVGKQDAAAKTEAALKKYGLEGVEKKKAGTLSGGWQRRLSIAMALITEPSVLFLDEPTLGLDVIARRELWSVIKELKGKMTVILTTHYLEEAEALSDRIGILTEGRLTAVGTAKELIEKSGEDNFEDAFISLAKKNGGAEK